MKLLDVKQLDFPEIKLIRFARFRDGRGYFTEMFRRSDFQTGPLTRFLAGVEFVQANESFSRAGTVRGLHFQWNPYMGKLVRTLRGHMVDLVLDIRKGSPTFGRIVACDMPADPDADFNEWIWVPPGFAHGNFFPTDTSIEYLCSGEYSAGCEAGISPLADDIDWSLCAAALRERFRALVRVGVVISDKDKSALSVNDWARDPRSEHFIF
jgi:dTDP-4-dehydrorhamnose 3,5-epimerase